VRPFRKIPAPTPSPIVINTKSLSPHAARMKFALGRQIGVVIHEHRAFEFTREHRPQGHSVPILQRGEREYRTLINVHNRRNTDRNSKQPCSGQPSLSEQLPRLCRRSGNHSECTAFSLTDLDGRELAQKETPINKSRSTPRQICRQIARELCGRH